MRLVVALVGDAASDLDARAASARWCADAIDALDGVAACERAMRDGEDDDDDGCATGTTRANDDDDDALRANGLGAASRGARYVARAWGTGIARALASDGRESETTTGVDAETLRETLRDARIELSRENGEGGRGASAEEAAASACGAMERANRERGVWVDVIWFAPNAAAVGDFKRGAAWTTGMVAAYGVFRRAKACFGTFARCRVVLCGEGGGSEMARAVADAAGASISNVGDDETVDLGERWRGTLAFASSSGKDRVEIHGLRATRLQPRASADDGEEETMDATATTSSAPRPPAPAPPRASALRVVEIVRARDIPSVYLSSTLSLCVRMDDVPESRDVREALFSSWSAAFADAPTPGDVPAMVVKTQWMSGTAARRQYRDVSSDGQLDATPMLLYPVRRGADGLEFHLRAFATVPELLRRLSASAGASGLNKVNVAMDNMSTLARQNALDEADHALGLLSARQSVKLKDIVEDADVVEDVNEDVYKDAEPNLVPLDEAISPEIGAVKSSQIFSAVAAASRGTRSSEGDAYAAYARRWDRGGEATRVGIRVDPGATKATNTATSHAYALRFDDIADRLMDVNESSVSNPTSRRVGEQDALVEGFLIETFSKSIDVAMSQFDQNAAAATILPRIGRSNVVEDAEAREKSFRQLISETDEDARAQRRAERKRQIEERREKTFLALGIRKPSTTTTTSSSIIERDAIARPRAAAAAQQSQRHQALAFDAVAADARDPLKENHVAKSSSISCPACACALNHPVGAVALKFCYECGAKL